MSPATTQGQHGQVHGCGVKDRHPVDAGQAAADRVSVTSGRASCFAATPSFRMLWSVSARVLQMQIHPQLRQSLSEHHAALVLYFHQSPFAIDLMTSSVIRASASARCASPSHDSPKWSAAVSSACHLYDPCLAFQDPYHSAKACMAQ